MNYDIEKVKIYDGVTGRKDLILLPRETLNIFVEVFKNEEKINTCSLTNPIINFRDGNFYLDLNNFVDYTEKYVRDKSNIENRYEVVVTVPNRPKVFKLFGKEIKITPIREKCLLGTFILALPIKSVRRDY